MKSENVFLKHLVSLQNRRIVREVETFEYFYDLTKKKIQTRAESSQNEYLMVIPSYCTGLPIYDNKNIASRIDKQFKKDGFLSTLVKDCMIYINWSPKGLEMAKIDKQKKDSKRRKLKLEKSKKATNKLEKEWGI